MTTYYSSLDEFADAVEHNDTDPRAYQARTCEPSIYRQLVKYCRTGDISLVARAEELLSQINADLAALERRQWHASPYGSYTVVPEYLAGIPTPMRRMFNQPDDTAPMNIYVSLSLSCGVEPESALRRGMALLALVTKMQAIRPCQLHLIEESDHTDGEDGNHIQVIRMDTQPLNLAVCAYVLTCDNFARKLMYGNAEHLGGSCSWPVQRGRDEYPDLLRDWIGATPRDIVFSAMNLYNPETQHMINNPVSWVNSVVEAYNERIEELEG